MASEDEQSKVRGDGGDAAGADAASRVNAGADEGDDLAALAEGLPSLRPGPGEANEAGDEAPNLDALARVSAVREEAPPAEHDDARLDLARLVGSASATLEPAAATPLVTDAATNDAMRAAAMASVMPPARPRASWLLPLLIGLGLGVGLAAVFGLSANRAPAPGTGAPSVLMGGAGPSGTGPATAPAPAPAMPAPAVATTAPSSDAPPATDTAARARADEHHLTASAAALAQHGAARVERATPPAAPPANDAPPVLLVRPETPPAAAAPTRGNDPLAEPADDGKVRDARSMDSLLDEALAPEAKKQELAHQRELAIHDNELPLAPSRDDVTKTMTVLLPAIRGCAMGQSGLATAGIVVRNDGRVASVEVAGAPFAGTPSGRCMEGVMRRAQFPRFKQAIFRIKFPFAIQ